MSAPDVRTPRVPAEANAEHNKNHLDSDAFRSEAQEISRYAIKRQANLQARAALHGVALHRLADGCWLACRWGLSRELADSEVEAWLKRVGVSV